MRPPQPEDRAYLSALDGLRAIAAIAILIFHYKHFGMTGPRRSECAQCIGFEPLYAYLWPIYQYGDYAVQLFWIISGVVFSRVYLGRNIGSRTFWVNRFARLYPLHFLTLIVVTILQFIIIVNFQTTLIYGGFDLRNFFLQIFLASNWFNDDLYTFNGPIWSVSVEIVAYALFWVFRERLFQMRPISMASLVAICFLAAPFSTPSPIIKCAGFFFSGVAIVNWMRHAPSEPWMDALVVSFILLLLSFWSTIELGMYLGLVGVVVCVILMEPFVSQRRRAAFGWLADCTYGLYLWHVPVQLTLMLAIGPGAAMARVASSPLFAFSWLIGMVLIARASFLFIEAPARTWLRDRLSTLGRDVKRSDSARRFT